MFSSEQLNFFLFRSKQYNKSFKSYFPAFLYDPNTYLVKLIISLDETILFPQ